MKQMSLDNSLCTRELFLLLHSHGVVSLRLQSKIRGKGNLLHSLSLQQELADNMCK